MKRVFLAFLLFCFTFSCLVFADCPTGWTSFEDSCYRNFGLMNWENAMSVCDENNAYVTVIDTPEENNWVRGFSGHYDNWVGYTDRHGEGWWYATYGWSEYTRWNRGEPNDANGEDCVQIYNSGWWNDINCGREFNAICELKKVNVQPVNVCPEGWSIFGDSCYGIYGPSTWYDARGSCESMGAYLVNIESGEENDFLKRLIWEDTWIGFHDINREGNWIWTYEDNVYSHWDAGEPNNYMSEEDCAHLRPKGTWNDHRCRLFMYYICEVPLEPLPVSCPKGWINRHYSCYKRVKGDWNSVKSECESLGAHLITINDWGENNWASNYGGWIGYNDINKEGDWEWSNGSSTFTRWNHHEPNNAGGEDCAEFTRGDYWNDAGCGLIRNALCELEVTPGTVFSSFNVSSVDLCYSPSCSRKVGEPIQVNSSVYLKGGLFGAVDDCSLSYVVDVCGSVYTGSISDCTNGFIFSVPFNNPGLCSIGLSLVDNVYGSSWSSVIASIQVGNNSVRVANSNTGSYFIPSSGNFSKSNNDLMISNISGMVEGVVGNPSLMTNISLSAVGVAGLVTLSKKNKILEYVKKKTNNTTSVKFNPAGNISNDSTFSKVVRGWGYKIGQAAKEVANLGKGVVDFVAKEEAKKRLFNEKYFWGNPLLRPVSDAIHSTLQVANFASSVGSAVSKDYKNYINQGGSNILGYVGKKTSDSVNAVGNFVQTAWNDYMNSWKTNPWDTLSKTLITAGGAVAAGGVIIGAAPVVIGGAGVAMLAGSAGVIIQESVGFTKAKTEKDLINDATSDTEDIIWAASGIIGGVTALKQASLISAARVADISDEACTHIINKHPDDFLSPEQIGLSNEQKINIVRRKVSENLQNGQVYNYMHRGEMKVGVSSVQNGLFTAIKEGKVATSFLPTTNNLYNPFYQIAPRVSNAAINSASFLTSSAIVAKDRFNRVSSPNVSYINRKDNFTPASSASNSFTVVNKSSSSSSKSNPKPNKKSNNSNSKPNNSSSKPKITSYSKPKKNNTSYVKQKSTSSKNTSFYAKKRSSYVKKPVRSSSKPKNVVKSVARTVSKSVKKVVSKASSFVKSVGSSVKKTFSKLFSWRR